MEVEIIKEQKYRIPYSFPIAFLAFREAKHINNHCNHPKNNEKLGYSIVESKTIIRK